MKLIKTMVLSSILLVGLFVLPSKISAQVTKKYGGILINKGTLTAISGTTLTVTRDGQTYTVLTSSSTVLKRKYWGSATLDQMQTGDTVNVRGTINTGAQNTIQASLVRDFSIQTLYGYFYGNVLTLTDTGWTMTSQYRGNQTVTVSSTTKYINGYYQPITQADIKVGDKIRVKGLGNSQSSTITQVTEVMDFSIGQK